MCSAFCDDNNKLTKMINSAQQNENRFVRPRVKCVCHAQTEEAWRNVDKHFVIEGAPVLTKDSFLECKFGGIIRFCAPPKPGDTDAPQTVGEQVTNNIMEKLDSLQKKREAIKNSITKEKVRQMIAEGKIPQFEDMEHDYYYVSLGLSYGELASIDQTDGMIIDKMGNVYFYSELGGGLGVSTPVQGSVGFGDFYSDDKENSGEYRDAIKGESAGFNIDMGVQFGVSKGANSPVARDVGITSGVGCSVSERNTIYLFNVFDD